MSITNADIAALPTYTDAELLSLYRWGLANNAAGQQRTINGRSVTFPTQTELLKTIEWLEGRVESAGDGEGGNIALAQFGEAQ